MQNPYPDNNHSSTFNGFIEEEDAKSTWVTTYADMMTLLMVFFIALYTLYHDNSEAFKNSLDVIEVWVGDSTQKVNLVDYLQSQQIDSPITLEEFTGLRSKSAHPAEQVVKITNDEQMSKGILPDLKGRKIVLQVSGELLFQSGSAVLSPSVKPLFEKLNRLFKKHPDYKIQIAGHTDNQPIQTALFPSNWELSAVRATTVLRYFLQSGISPKRISATGYADMIPIESNDTPTGRSANRRVEFVLEKYIR